jgi:phosphomannomutase
MQKEVEKHFTRTSCGAPPFGAVGDISYPAAVRESYAQDLLAALDVDAVRERRFRLVVDYGCSSASFVLPLLLGPLGVETVSAHEFASDSPRERHLAARIARPGEEARDRGRRRPGRRLRPAGERLFLVDEQAHEVPVEQTLLLFLRLLGSTGAAASSPSRSR